MISLEQLMKINHVSGVKDYVNMANCEVYIDPLKNILPKYQIDTPLRLAHFLAQVIHESGHLRCHEENLNYGAAALLKVFPKYFKTEAEANRYARQPQKIASRVYADRMGNGNEASGDGWKFRGRGLIQLTGRDNYGRCGKALGIDLAGDPDQLCKSPSVIVSSVCWFWSVNSLNDPADRDDVVAVTKRVNGGTNGLADRTAILAAAKKTLGC